MAVTITIVPYAEMEHLQRIKIRGVVRTLTTSLQCEGKLSSHKQGSNISSCIPGSICGDCVFYMSFHTFYRFSVSVQNQRSWACVSPALYQDGTLCKALCHLMDHTVLRETQRRISRDARETSRARQSHSLPRIWCKYNGLSREQLGENQGIAGSLIPLYAEGSYPLSILDDSRHAVFHVIVLTMLAKQARFPHIVQSLLDRQRPFSVWLLQIASTLLVYQKSSFGFHRLTPFQYNCDCLWIFPIISYGLQPIFQDCDSPYFGRLDGISHCKKRESAGICQDLTNRRAVTASSPASASRSYSPTTGRLALNWTITPQASLYAQYATAADPPSGIMATASFADVLNNDKLTTGTQKEVGGKFEFWDGRGSATVAAYEITRKNISAPDANNPAVSVPVGQQSARGLELAGGLRLTRTLSLQANVAFVDPQYDDFSETVGGVRVSRNGNVPTNTPRRVANAWIDYAFLPDWNASVAARYVGRAYADAANTVWAPSYTVFDAALSHRIDRHFTVTGRVRNLTDKVYAANVTGAPMFYLGAPRSFELTLQARF